MWSLVPAASATRRYCGRRVAAVSSKLCQRRFFGGFVSRPACAGFVAFFLAAPGVAAARRRPPFPVDRRCIAASMLAHRARLTLLGWGPARRLGIDQRGQRLSVFVAVPAWVQLLIRQRVDQRLGHGELLGGGGPLILIRLERELGLPDLVRPQHGREDEHIAVYPQHRDDLAITERDLGDRDAAPFSQCVA